MLQGCFKHDMMRARIWHYFIAGKGANGVEQLYALCAVPEALTQSTMTGVAQSMLQCPRPRQVCPIFATSILYCKQK
jgi:hypothetical protein